MSTGVGMSSCCLSGKVHDGTPTGKIETIGHLQTYVAAPSDGSKARTIVFIVDIFGWEFKNVRLLADNYAKAGFYCYIPDVHQGDSLPLDFLNSVEPPLKTREQMTMIEKTKATAVVGTTLPPWLIRHREAISKPIIEKFFKDVRQIPGTGKVGAIGFCWGGRYAILAAHGVVDAAYACHPSLVAVPGDFEAVTKPLSLAVGDKDSLLDKATVGQIQDLMAKKTALPHELRIYEDQVHGFALRSDWSSEKDKKAMDDAEKQGTEWFSKHLA
ncbi:hypothetical protein LZ554_002502 [Drepanopeziza brunnea f. sp. 'monogermtubi']|nr:hypothetical protein LZ554_002502 [Drepanopeziza brunnea f. sp. 'monogermtubi']